MKGGVENVASGVSGGTQYVWEAAGTGTSAVKGGIENTASTVREGAEYVGSAT